MRKLEKGYWHNPAIKGTGVSLLMNDTTIAGVLFTLGRSGQQIVTTFAKQANFTNSSEEVIDLYYYAARGWPGDANTAPILPDEKVGSITLRNTTGDSIHVTVSLEHRIVGGLHPSPMPPPNTPVTFSADMHRLI